MQLIEAIQADGLMQNALKTGAMMRGEINDHFIAPGAALLALSYAIMYIEKEVDGFFALDNSAFLADGSVRMGALHDFLAGKEEILPISLIRPI